MPDLLNDPNMQANLADALMRKYYKYKGLEWGGEKVLGKVLGNGDDDLARKERLLGIMQKQRSLNMPIDDQEYQDSVNQKTSTRKILERLSMRKLLQKVPQPGIWEHTTNALQPFFKIATHIEDELPLSQSIKSSGDIYGRIFGGISRRI